MSDLTKRALSESLKNKMQTTALDKITVNDIALDCGVNRRSFYYHFHDIYDLLEWLLVNDFLVVLGPDKTYDTWQTGFSKLLHYLHNNRKITMNIYQNISRDVIESHLNKSVLKLIGDVIEERNKDLHIQEDYIYKIANFYRISLVGVILDWVKNNMSIPPEEVVADLDVFLDGDFYRILKRYEKK